MFERRLGGTRASEGVVVSYILDNFFLIDGVDDGPRLVCQSLIGTNNFGGRLRNDCQWEQESRNDEAVKKHFCLTVLVWEQAQELSDFFWSEGYV